MCFQMGGPLRRVALGLGEEVRLTRRSLVASPKDPPVRMYDRPAPEQLAQGPTPRHPSWQLGAVLAASLRAALGSRRALVMSWAGGRLTATVQRKM
jgi:hypothetical protein